MIVLILIYSKILLIIFKEYELNNVDWEKYNNDEVGRIISAENKNNFVSIKRQMIKFLPYFKN